MNPKHKLEVLPPVLRQHDLSGLDAFHEDRVRLDLAMFARAPGLFSQYVERARVRFHKAGERAILERWIEFYESGERLVAAKTAMERQKSEYVQLAREHEVKETETTASLAKLQADIAEHGLREDTAVYRRRRLEQFGEGATPRASGSDNEQKLNEAQERRDLDARWELNESLRSLQTLLELQRWRRQQRDQILKERSSSSQEQGEALQFVDDLYDQKRAELKVDTRIFEEG